MFVGHFVREHGARITAGCDFVILQVDALLGDARDEDLGGQMTELGHHLMMSLRLVQDLKMRPVVMLGDGHDEIHQGLGIGWARTCKHWVHGFSTHAEVQSDRPD